MRRLLGTVLLAVLAGTVAAAAVAPAAVAAVAGVAAVATVMGVAGVIAVAGLIALARVAAFAAVAAWVKPPLFCLHKPVPLLYVYPVTQHLASAVGAVSPLGQ
jgi:hypothetical protein